MGVLDKESQTLGGGAGGRAMRMRKSSRAELNSRAGGNDRE